MKPAFIAGFILAFPLCDIYEKSTADLIHDKGELGGAGEAAGGGGDGDWVSAGGGASGVGALAAGVLSASRAGAGEEAG